MPGSVYFDLSSLAIALVSLFTGHQITAVLFVFSTTLVTDCTCPMWPCPVSSKDVAVRLQLRKLVYTICVTGIGAKMSNN